MTGPLIPISDGREMTEVVIVNVMPDKHATSEGGNSAFTSGLNFGLFLSRSMLIMAHGYFAVILVTSITLAEFRLRASLSWESDGKKPLS